MVICGVIIIIRVTQFRALITLLITYLLSPLPLQVGSLGFTTVQAFDKVHVPIWYMFKLHKAFVYLSRLLFRGDTVSCTWRIMGLSR